jgi:methylthioribose-1-phosphate isomerase
MQVLSDLRPIRAEGESVVILDQTALPYRIEMRRLATAQDAAHAIRSMQVRGAPLIGATAAYGLALGMLRDASDRALDETAGMLAATRPTAVNLLWALQRQRSVLAPLAPAERAAAAWNEARRIAAEDAAANRAIGENGLAILRDLAQRRGRAIHVMTHCNAGWLATVAHGTALAPVYAAHAAGIAIHVFVSETRPRNQGLLTAWELSHSGVPHTLIADNAAGHLLQQGRVDAVIVGADRIAANGDVANKIGTYLKALAAREAGVPFHVAAPASTIDWTCASGAQIPIEERSGEEVRVVRGAACDARIAGDDTAVSNPAFDVTPAHLVTGIITERGIAAAARLAALFADAARPEFPGPTHAASGSGANSSC